VSVETFVRLAQRQPWMAHAICKGAGDVFFPTETRPARVNPQQYERGVKLCQSCPVIDECREYGRDEKFGVWGGTTPADRSPRMAIAAPGKCGTQEGYSAHIRRSKTEPCERCQEAHARFVYARRQAS
jgi:WhiB family transcriptional regulator, redox-sensing transcriptional regulator